MVTVLVMVAEVGRKHEQPLDTIEISVALRGDSEQEEMTEAAGSTPSSRLRSLAAAVTVTVVEATVVVPPSTVLNLVPVMVMIVLNIRFEIKENDIRLGGNGGGCGLLAQAEIFAAEGLGIFTVHLQGEQSVVFVTDLASLLQDSLHVCCGTALLDESSLLTHILDRDAQGGGVARESGGHAQGGDVEAHTDGKKECNVEND